MILIAAARAKVGEISPAMKAAEKAAVAIFRSACLKNAGCNPHRQSPLEMNGLRCYAIEWDKGAVNPSTMRCRNITAGKKIKNKSRRQADSAPRHPFS